MRRSSVRRYWLRALFQEYAQQLAFAGKPRGAEGSGVPSANSIARRIASIHACISLSDVACSMRCASFPSEEFMYPSPTSFENLAL